jgi:hypothetical protein
MNSVVCKNWLDCVLPSLVFNTRQDRLTSVLPSLVLVLVADTYMYVPAGEVQHPALAPYHCIQDRLPWLQRCSHLDTPAVSEYFCALNGIDASMCRPPARNGSVNKDCLPNSTADSGTVK